MGQPTELRSLAANTPTERNRAVDLVRAAAILAVVVGHWLMAAVYVDAHGEVSRRNLLGIADWTHPATWLFQVIPLFFVLGGFSNAVWWQHAVRDGLGHAPWLSARSTG